MTKKMNESVYRQILSAFESESGNLEEFAEEYPAEMDAAMRTVYEREARNNECQDCD